MKKICFLTIAILTITVSCKNAKKKHQNQKVATSKAVTTYVVKPEATTVEWTAYKTTAKTPVKGTFTTLKFDEVSGHSVTEALNNLHFSIPISSVFSNNDARDMKLKKYFFKAMQNTDFIDGTLKYYHNAWIASITMNGVTHDLPLKMKIENQRRVTLTGTMLLKNWNALKAVASLNKICFALHKGADGISKTWGDVAIKVSTFLRAH